MNARTSKRLGLVFILAMISLAWCMTGGPYVLEWSTIDGGGGTSSGGAYILRGTIGQPDAAWSSGGKYQVLGGFWGGAPIWYLTLNIDIYPNRTPNRVYLSRNYTLYVAVLGSADFNVTTLNSSTVKFGKTGTEASPMRAPMIRDLNGDGKPDAMYGFRTFGCDFQLGDTKGWLKGFTASGTPVEGSDSVVVLP